MLLRRGESGPPCGVPSSTGLTKPSKLFRVFVRCKTRPSSPPQPPLGLCLISHRPGRLAIPTGCGDYLAMIVDTKHRVGDIPKNRGIGCLGGGGRLIAERAMAVSRGAGSITRPGLDRDRR